MSEQPNVLTGWAIENIGIYFLGVLGADLLIRFVIAGLKSWDKEAKASFRGAFLAYGPGDEHPDLWYPFILGFLELLCYPLVMRVGAWSFVGAWVGFKAVAQWKIWQERRQAFNRYLIGNALTLFLAAVLSVLFVQSAPSPSSGKASAPATGF